VEQSDGRREQEGGRGRGHGAGSVDKAGPWRLRAVADAGWGTRGAETMEMLICVKI